MEGLGRTWGVSVCGVVDAIIDWDLTEQEWVDAFQTADVVPVLVGKRAALVVRVDAADAAKVVLCHARIELVEAKVFFTREYADATQRDRRDDGTLAPANGTVAAARVDDAVR